MTPVNLNNKPAQHLAEKLKLTRIAGAILLSPLPLVAQDIVIDGKFDEPQWQTAKQYNSFYQVVPATLAQHHDKVLVKAFADEKGVYIGYTNFQAQDERKKQYNLQDGFMQADFDRFVIDFSGDGSGAYLFAVTLGGGIQDAVLTPQLSTDYDWDGIWQVANFETQDYWTSEIFIPWYSVSFRPQQNAQGLSQVGLSFQLYELASNYIYGSQPQTTGNSDFYLNMPKVEWHIPKQQQLAFIPYITHSYDANAGDGKTDIGFDLLYKPNHHQKISIAINPDFGQVDSDELNFNYSNVETLLSDKRPFFTQDISLFNVALLQDTKLIHTRRIGAGSDDGSEVITPIDGAIRAVHQGESVNVGAFAVAEDNLASNAGKRFYAARSTYRGDGWQTGVLATLTERPWLRRDANTLAWDSQYQSETWSWQSAVLRSEVSAPDENAAGYGFSGSAKYQFSPNADLSANFLRLDEQFDNNDIGYSQRNNWRYASLNGGYAINTNSEWLSRVRHSFIASYQANDSGLKLVSEQSYGVALLLANGAQLESYLNYNMAGWNDNIGYNSNAFYQSGYFTSRVFYASPYVGQFSWAASFQLDQEGVDGLARQYAVDTTWMPHENWTIKFNNFYRQGDGWLVANNTNQVTQYDRDFFVSLLNVSGLVIDNLEFSFNLQWAVLEANTQQVYQIEQGELVAQNNQDTSFDDKRFSAQFKLRYKLGAYSDIYLVYNRAGAAFNEQTINEPWLSGVADLWSQPEQDLVTFKLRYLL